MTSPATTSCASVGRPAKAWLGLCAVIVIAMLACPAFGETASTSHSAVASMPATSSAEVLAKLPGVGGTNSPASTLSWVLIATALSLAPAILVLMTCFTRIIVVLSLLRAALASQQLPPNQVLFGLAALMTVVVMWPTYNKIHQDAIGPYLSGQASQAQALSAGEQHIRDFMIRQIESAGNNEDVLLFMDAKQAQQAKTWIDVPTRCLIPGYVISELKVAFTMGFKIFLPFLIIDMLVASVLVSMGMLMLPPVLISLPFKLLLFVLANGWHLVVGTLMTSFE
jgi:flagellar biosynthetic protein FliP